MPEIQIRPAIEHDIPALIAIDHHYVTDFVWQMEVQSEEAGQIQVNFREARLPRSVRVEYPRKQHALEQEWAERSGLLAALQQEDVVGYINLSLNVSPGIAWVTDLAVRRRSRRQGIGSALLLAGEEWAVQQGCRQMVIEMQPKNYPALKLAHKLGFEFCGYNDRYYPNHEIGLFFGKSLR